MHSYVQSHLKDMNRLTVYNLLGTGVEVSKADITRLTGISAPTVIKIVQFLTQQGLVLETGEGDNAVGRKAQMLRLNPDAFCAVSAVLEGNFLSLGVVNLSGEIRHGARVLLKKVQIDESFFLYLSDHIKCVIRDAGVAADKLLGVGLGLPVIFNHETGLIRESPLVGIVEPLPIGPYIDRLEATLAMPVLVENDVNMAAVGEFNSLRLTGVDDFVYLALGTGLGAGIILDGRLRRGRNAMAGEIGALQYDPGLRLEEDINFDGLQKRFQVNLKDGESVLSPEKKTAVIDYVAPRLAWCVRGLSAVLDTEPVVLGGVIVEMLGRELLEQVYRAIADTGASPPDLRLSGCETASVLGGASLVAEERIPFLLQ